MERKVKIAIVVFVLVIVSFPYWFTFIIAGPPMPLFSAYNSYDISQIVTIEIMDSDNSSIFSGSKELQPGSSWEQEKPLGMIGASFIDWAGEKYIVHGTLSNGVTDNISIDYHPWNSADISIRSGIIELGEITV